MSQKSQPASRDLFVQMQEETETLALDLKLKTVMVELPPLMVIIPVVIMGVTICSKTHLSLHQSG